jgi:hypothetical protein
VTADQKHRDKTPAAEPALSKRLYILYSRYYALQPPTGTIRGKALKFDDFCGKLNAGVSMDENRGYLFAEWKDEEALEYRYNEGFKVGFKEGRNERRNIMVLELAKQGYTAEQIEAKLAQTTAGTGE